MAKKGCAHDKNPFVAIGSTLGGLLIGLTVIIAIFAQAQLWIVPIVAACFVVLGGILAYFAYKAEK